MQKSDKTPWLWVPTLYLFEGLPYFLVNTVALAVFKDMGVDNGTLGPLTTLISLPWLVKPFWSPFVDILRSKRWWITTMQVLMAVAAGLTALSLPLCPLSVTISLFVLVAFASATHDISADGFYMIALDGRQQSLFVGIRSTFYRIASVFGQGVLVMTGGLLQKRWGDIPRAWSAVLLLSSALLAILAVYHLFALPRPEIEAGKKRLREILKEFAGSFSSFFRKRGVWYAIGFMLLYRLPEALSLNLLYPFFKDGKDLGGLGAGTEVYGLVYGTFGVIALLAGGILGGVYAARRGLKRSLWPMAASLALPCAVYLVMAILRTDSLWVIGSFIVLDQLGYGFGFTAYMLYMMNFVDGPMKTSHYAICTAFMWLSMKIPALFAGYLQQAVGYVGFFSIVMLSCAATAVAVVFARKQIV